MANKNTRRSRAASGTLLRVLCPIALTLMVGCGGGNADSSQPQGDAGVGGMNAGGSSSTGGSGGAGDGGSGGSGNAAGSTGSAGQMAGAGGEGGNAGSGGNAGDAGNGGTGNTGNNGGAGGSSPCGEAGHGSTTEGEGTNCAGTSGMSGTAGSSGTSAAAGTAGAAGESGSAGIGGSSGSSGTGSAGSNAGSAGTGGTGNAGAGGSAGTAAGSSGTGGIAGAAGESGSAGIGGSSGSSGTGSAGSNAGSAGTGGTGNAGAGGDAGTAGVAGSAGSSGTGSAGSNAGSAGTAGSAGSGGAVQNTFVCSSWNRNAALDAANTDQFPFVGGVWGTGANSVYVTLHNQNVSSGVFHWDGTAWTKTVMPGDPPELNGIWGSNDDDIWVAARNFSGYLYHKSGGVWSDDPNKPNAKSFKQVWGTSSDDVWLLGATNGWNYRVWRRNGGTTWVQQSLPSLANGTVLQGLWGIDGHVFVTGYNVTDSNPSGGVLLHFDGSNWESMTVPGTAMRLAAVHGTSVDDLYLAGDDAAGTAYVYHLANLGTWQSYSTTEMAYYYSVLSKKPGTFLAGGRVGSSQNGMLRISTFDKNGLKTVTVDGLAYNPIGFWSVPGSNSVYSIGNAYSGTAGVYTATCN